MFQSPIQCLSASMAVAMHNSSSEEQPPVVHDKKKKEEEEEEVGLTNLRLKSTDSFGENDSPKSVLHTQESVPDASLKSLSTESDVTVLHESKKPRRTATAMPHSISRTSMTTFIREDWVECYASCTVDAATSKTKASGLHSTNGDDDHQNGNGNKSNSLGSGRRDALWFEDTVAPQHDSNRTKCSCSGCQSQSGATPPTSNRDLPLEMSVLMEQMALQIEDSIESQQQQQQQQQESGSNKLSHRDSQLSLSSLHLDRLSSDFLTEEAQSDSDSETAASDVAEEIEDIIDNEDMLLNNMERQWHGKDYLMEHIGSVAAMKSQDGESLPSQHYESF